MILSDSLHCSMWFFMSDSNHGVTWVIMWVGVMGCPPIHFQTRKLICSVKRVDIKEKPFLKTLYPWLAFIQKTWGECKSLFNLKWSKWVIGLALNVWWLLRSLYLRKRSDFCFTMQKVTYLLTAFIHSDLCQRSRLLVV